MIKKEQQKHFNEESFNSRYKKSHNSRNVKASRMKSRNTGEEICYFGSARQIFLHNDGKMKIGKMPIPTSNLILPSE